MQCIQMNASSGFYLEKKNAFELIEEEEQGERERNKREILTDPIKYFFVRPPEPHHSQKAVVMRQLLLLLVLPLKWYSRRHKRVSPYGTVSLTFVSSTLAFNK